jgi:iron complex outermembrane receptor protein
MQHSTLVRLARTHSYSRSHSHSASASRGAVSRVAPRDVALRVLGLLTAAALTSTIAPNAWAQATPPVRDSAARADTGQRIERVLVSAIRAGDRAPISQKTIARDVITQRHFGQDVPMLLQGASPSLTAHTETGTNWGYSYLRLRGVDQTRINITLDGIPLNDMEDQVLYFANFADLMASVQSVQVQRGVGTSTAGTASFAGSVNFETTPIALGETGGDVSVQVGSFGAQRVSAGFRSGLTDSRFAVYGRASALRTNGYRDHSGVEGRSAFVGAGWFGDRTIVKATALVGLLADTLSYTGATLAELRQNRRFNPLSPEELDKFGQQMFALSVSHSANDALTLNTTVYRNSASGNYDFFFDADRYRFGLAHTWYGVTSAATIERGNLQVNTGVNANTYQRAHRGFLRPDLTTSLYDNTGHKQDASAFAKATLDQGRIRWFADVQTRWARFRYEPDPRAGIDERSIDWVFFNPKAGATVQLGGAWSAYASYGLTTREPARSDLFAGDDDLNAGNVADYGDFTRVKPESVRDLEAGVTWAAAGRSLQANVYSMDFRNDIARIGPPTASGSIVRRNVGASYRRGVEVDGRWQLAPRVALGGNAALSTNRIRSFTDSSRGTPVVRRNVEPLLTPRFMSAQRLELAASKAITLTVEGRYQSRAYLDNTSSPDRVLPDFFVLDATARATWSRYSLTLRGANLGDTQKFGSGSVSGSGTVRYFVLPARAVFATFDVSF